MVESPQFLKSVLDALTEQIAVTKRDGTICLVNQSWIDFACANGAAAPESWDGVNYLHACRQAADAGDRDGAKALAGIQRVMDGRAPRFRLEYPCHSPDVKRWFVLEVTPFRLEDRDFFVVAHHDITKRKLAEERLVRASRMDGLTGVYNRHYFDEVLELEWRRCQRLRLPVTLAMIDIDHFKLFNDTYGHQAGDECLRSIASTLNKFTRRPGDICARYGGEEFAVLLANTGIGQSVDVFEEMLQAVRGLDIPNEASPTASVVTVSIGVASAYPHETAEPAELWRDADALLYEAKRSGRNRVCRAR